MSPLSREEMDYSDPSGYPEARERFPLLLAVMLLLAGAMSVTWHYFSDDEEPGDEIVRFDMRIEFGDFRPEGDLPGGDFSENTTVWHFMGDEFEIFHYTSPGAGSGGSDDETVWLFSNVTLEQCFILDAMLYLERQCGFKISTQEYEAFDSVLIIGIAGVENNEDDSGAYWQYWVNGEYAVEGADHVLVEDGMLVRWRLESF